MSSIPRRTAIAAATLFTATTGVLGVATTTAGASPAATPSAGPSAGPSAAALPGCHARDLSISLGRLDAGAGQRYQDVRIANVSDHGCRLTGYPRFRFEVAGRRVGSASQHQGMAVHPVRLQVGDSAWTTIWYTDPGPVPAADCDAVTTTSVRMHLPHRPHRYEVALSASVCTTGQYRPVAYPVRDRKVF